ncbi:MAG: tRNA preQ1(34) S-adenosylmethionine ribosyltransferase-isomerase QueA [Spirochaetales bacterium]|nr:tRNA preQ1(34) S-adenosylmethionine ribosyltransferase-isomerase QueA [Spirochaetales bacterium]
MKNQTDFDRLIARHTFDLPDHLIARHPRPREESRLLVVDRKEKSLQDTRFSELPAFLQSGDLLIFNESRVSPRRLFLKRQTGSIIESLFLHQEEGSLWHVLLRGLGRLRPDELLSHRPSGVSFRFLERRGSGAILDAGNQDMEAFFERYGELALPPYMDRRADYQDRERYQTIFARRPGSVAAPTAGLHFTPDLFSRLRNQGIEPSFLDLEIGYGTFAPLQREQMEKKALHEEHYQLSSELLHNFEKARRRIAVGTTSLRALESYRRSGHNGPGRYATNLFLYPPDRITAVEGLITNFHLPGSSLMLLVAAFAGTELLQEAYAHAIMEEYRFYSYGDAMLIL